MNDQAESSGSNELQASGEVRPDVFAARITGDRQTLLKLVQTFALEVGCRHAEVEGNPDGTATMLVYASENRLREIQGAGYKVEIGENVSAIGRQRQADVGKGDRFEGGRVTPRGLGKKPGCENRGGSAS
jgi:hypothetical protein